MSIGREIFGRAWNALARRTRNSEEYWARVITNTKLLRRYVFYGGVVYCTGQLFQHYVLEWGEAKGLSMYPTMPEKTPFTLTSKLHSQGKNMSPGDMVNFTSPIFRGQPLGKRLIGAPGDFVVLDPHQAPSVGGAAVPLITNWRSQTEIDNGIKLKEREEPMMVEVPEGHIYAVGDNLSWSRDSRFFGPVPMALVNGKQILHRNSGFGKGWTWTAGEQLRRIPKDEEEEYLRGYARVQHENQKVAGHQTTAHDQEDVD